MDTKELNNLLEYYAQIKIRTNTYLDYCNSIKKSNPVYNHINLNIKNNLKSNKIIIKKLYKYIKNNIDFSKQLKIQANAIELSIGKKLHDGVDDSSLVKNKLVIYYYSIDLDLINLFIFLGTNKIEFKINENTYILYKDKDERSDLFYFNLNEIDIKKFINDFKIDANDFIENSNIKNIFSRIKDKLISVNKEIEFYNESLKSYEELSKQLMLEFL